MQGGPRFRFAAASDCASLASDVADIFDQNVQGAARDLQNHESDGIHECRKKLKKIRGLIRITKRGHEELYRKVNNELREAAQSVGVQRDCQAMVECLERLPAEALPRRGEAIALMQKRVPNGLDEKFLAQVTAKLAALSWVLSDNVSYEDNVIPCVKKLYAQGRKQLDVARRVPDGHNLHELRKASKKLFFVFQLFSAPVGLPSYYTTLMQDWKLLSDHLGDHHDLYVLEQLITVDEPHLLRDDEQLKQDLLRAISGEKRRLESGIFQLAPMLYWANAESFARLFRQVIVATKRI